MIRMITDVLEHVRLGHNILLIGPGGCGKSYCIQKLYPILKANRKKVCYTALTGVAALNLMDGVGGGFYTTTLHGWGGLPVGNLTNAQILAHVMKKKYSVKKWMETDILVIDEVSMMGANMLETMDYIAKALRDNDEPMGGLQLILSGDFLQLPPVKAEWIFTSPMWDEMDFHPIHFTIPKRYDDVEYFHLLQRIRKGIITPEDIQILNARVDAYRDLQLQMKKDKNMIIPTVLYPTKKDVSSYNDKKLEELPSDIKIFKARDSFCLLGGGHVQDSTREFYKKMMDDAIDEIIYLKVGAQVMLKKNFDQELGLVNGSRGIVMAMFPSSIRVRFVNGIELDFEIHTWTYEDRTVVVSRTQIPFILAWASTIHKVQGLSLDSAVGDCGSKIFCPAQAYVLLSRVRNLKGLYLSEFYPKAIKVDEDARDFVDKIEGVEIILSESMVDTEDVEMSDNDSNDNEMSDNESDDSSITDSKSIDCKAENQSHDKEIVHPSNSEKNEFVPIYSLPLEGVVYTIQFEN